MNKVSKYIIPFFFALLLSLTIQKVFADKYLLIEDEPLCNIPIYSGGINTFDSQFAETEEEIQEMESEVRNSDYIHISSQLERFEGVPFDFEKLLKSCKDENNNNVFYFEKYLNPNNTFRAEYSKVYMYKPVLEAYMEALEEDTLNENPYLTMELDISTVVIDYGVVYHHNRIGEDLSDEINDNIPEWFETGYLCIESPVSVKITLFLTEENNYYTFYVKKDEPFLVKIKQGGYNVVDVNSTETGDGEETLPFNDLIQITNINSTPEKAYRLQLEEFVETYHIQDIVIPDETEYSALDETFPIDMPVEKTTLETDESAYKEYPFSLNFLLIGGIAGIFLILTVISLIRKKSDTKQKENLSNE